MGETIEASSTSSGYDHGFGLYSRKVYMDAGTLSGDGKRVAVFQTYGGLSQEGYVYEWKSSSWSVVGDSIILNAAASVSYDGNVVAGVSGYVYKWSSGAWSETWSNSHPTYPPYPPPSPPSPPSPPAPPTPPP